MADVNILSKEKVDELRRKLWGNNEKMKNCIPKEKQNAYNGYFNNAGIEKVSEFVEAYMVLRIGASLDFDIKEIENALKVYNKDTLSNILKGFLSDSLISDWDFYQKLRKILRRYELQYNSVERLKGHYNEWIKNNIPPIDKISKELGWRNMNNTPYSYILCVDDLDKLPSETSLHSAYLLFKIYSNLIVCYEYCEDDETMKTIIETIKKFKDDLEKQLNDKFYFCFFPQKRKYSMNTEKEEECTYSNQTLIYIVDNIFPSCFYSDPVFKLSCKDNENRNELWNKHLIELKEKVEDNTLEETLEKYRVDPQEKKRCYIRKITGKQESVW